LMLMLIKRSSFFRHFSILLTGLIKEYDIKQEADTDYPIFNYISFKF